MRVTTVAVMMMRPWRTMMLPCMAMTRMRLLGQRRRLMGKTSSRTWRSK